MKHKFNGIKFCIKHWWNYFAMLQKRDKNKIRAFKNKHLGQRIFCIGAGPSLNKENLSLLNNEIIIFTNSSYKLLKHISPKSSYWLVQDNDRIKELIDVNETQFSSTFKSFHTLKDLEVKAYQNSVVLFPDIIIKKYKKIIPYPEVLFNQLSFSENLEDRIDLTGSSVIFSAIQLAYYLGASKIGLLGVDMSYSQDLKASYFDYNPSRVYFEPGTKEEYLVKRKPFFRFYKEFLFKKGVNCYNCSCETQEDELPKLSLESFLNS